MCFVPLPATPITLSLALPTHTQQAVEPLKGVAGWILITAELRRDWDASTRLENASEPCSDSCGPQQNVGKTGQSQAGSLAV